MKKNSFYFKNLIVFLFIIIFSLNTLGCSSSKKEIEKLFLVLAIGIDTAPDDKIELTMQVLSPSGSTSQTSGLGGSGSNVITMRAVGETFHDASYEISKTLSKSPHYGHTKYIVLGDAFARRPIGDFLDSITRIEEFRLNVPILVTKGKASEIVETKTSSSIPALEVENLYYRQELIGFRPFSYLIDFDNELNGKAASPVAAVINIKKNPSGSPDKVFDLSGAAVFKKDVLIGYLSAKETRGLQFIKGKVRIGDITFNSEKFGKVSNEILKVSSKVKPIINDDKITIEIDIKVDSSVRRISANIDPVKNPKVLDEIGAEQNKTIKNEIQNTLNAARDDLGVDIFGFADCIYKANPKVWKSAQKDWDSLYQNLDININVKSNIRSTGLANKSST